MAAHEGLNGSEDWENQPTRRSRRNGHISQPICSGMLRRLPSSRKKFRSQTSDNMDRWKSRDGKSQRREEKKKEDQKKRQSQKNQDPGARKGRKVAKHFVFPMICGVFNILTWKCASHHNGVDFFRHVNFQKWSDNGAVCTF